VTEEQFGPLLPVLPFDDVDPLIEQVNGEWSGLCSSVWTADEDRASHAGAPPAHGHDVGDNHNAVAMDDRAPFGGFRQSGIGREVGIEGLLDVVESRTVT
jgi:acyl-CoA reductase-like NAD-dependent aldehyde dehydrogenase